MRIVFSVLFIVMIMALARCAHIAIHSRKKVGYSLGQLLYGLIPPVLGNLIMICANSEPAAKTGCYIYFLGMDFVVFALLCFSINYCDYDRPGRIITAPVGAFLVGDCAQLLLNLFFGHAFDVEAVFYKGSVYYEVIPYAGQTFHRVVCYALLFAALIMFVVKAVRSPRIYLERYLVILVSMIAATIWESFYIFSRTPIDRSMIGFGVFGFLVFYFSFYYRYTRLLDNILANMASSMKEAVFIFNANGQCIWANGPALDLTGLLEDEYELAYTRLQEIFGDYNSLGKAWKVSRIVVDEERNLERYYILEEHTVTDRRGRASGMFLSIRDNTQQEVELRRERYNATHDSLTDLYTKEYLFWKIREVLDLRLAEKYYIVFIDIMNFKLVNDIFGNAFGDRTLCRIADRLKEYSKEGCLYGRLAADHFGMFIPEKFFDEKKLEGVLGRLPLTDGTTEYETVIHAGVNEVKDPSVEVGILFDWARMAMAPIHKDFNTAIGWYSDQMHDRAVWEQYISTQLTGAIAKKQIRMYLQPIVDRTGKVSGCEALVRWEHPVYGLLFPGAFIPVFEKNGRIAEVDRYMWRAACETLSRWKKDGRDEFISVNISPMDFSFLDVAQELRKLVREYGIKPEKLRLEITETAMMEEKESRIQVLKSLKEDGFLIEMDDFGSGYSSFNMLKEMPVDVIKIDLRFLKKTGDESKTDVIIRNIVRMSQELGIVPLTEGVETREQFGMLTAVGCQLCQGFYFAKPLPVSDFEENWLGDVV